jgi:putative transposase
VSRVRFVDAEQASYPIALLCRIAGVSRAGHYAWRRRGPSHRVQQDVARTTEILTIHAHRRATYGSPRVHAALCAEGTRVSRKRVMRLMRAAGLRGCGPRRRVRTTVSDPHATPAPNLVQRQFDAGALDRVWVTDSTDLATDAGWL